MRGYKRKTFGKSSLKVSHNETERPVEKLQQVFLRNPLIKGCKGLHYILNADCLIFLYSFIKIFYMIPH